MLSAAKGDTVRHLKLMLIGIPLRVPSERGACSAMDVNLILLAEQAASPRYHPDVFADLTIGARPAGWVGRGPAFMGGIGRVTAVSTGKRSSSP